MCTQGSEKVWQGLFMARFGLPSKNQETAHKLAGSWQVGTSACNSRGQATCAQAPKNALCCLASTNAANCVHCTPTQFSAVLQPGLCFTTSRTSHLPFPPPPTQALYKSKVVTDEAAGQWRKPCPFELQAALQTMVHTGNSPPNSSTTTTTTTPAAAAAVGSVSEEGSDSPGRQSSVVSTISTISTTSSNSSGGEGVAGSSSSLLSSTSLDSGVMNNEGVAVAVGAKTELAVIFLLDSSGSVGDGEGAQAPALVCCVCCVLCGG